MQGKKVLAIVENTLFLESIKKWNVENGLDTLIQAPSAVEGLNLGNEAIEFNARFGGVPMHVYVPILAVMAVYAKESGEGMGFGFEPGIPDPDGPSNSPLATVDKPKASGTVSSIASRTKRPTLKVVK